MDALKLLPLLGLLVVAVSTLGVTQAFAEDDFLVYENSIQGFQIQHPADWEALELQDSVIQVIFYSPAESDSDVFGENVMVVTERLPSPMSLDDYTALAKFNIETYLPSYQVLESGETTLAGMPAYKEVFTNEDEFGTKFNGMQIWTVFGQVAYVVTFQAENSSKFSSFLPTAQKMADSFEISGGPSLISGSYSLEEIGLEIEFPPGWDGVEVKGDVIMAMATPGITVQPFSQSPELSSQLEMSMIMILVGDFKTIETMIEEQTPPDSECEPDSSTIIELNGITTHELLTDCQSPDLGTVKGLQYTMFTQDEAILVMYIAISQEPDKTFNEEISAFQESLKTLKIDNTLDVLGPADYADLFDQTLFTHAVMIDNKLQDIEIVSDTRIDKFSFDEEKREISFKIIKQEGTREDTTLFVDNILSPPYTVKLDEYKTIDDHLVTEDRTTGRTTISFYDHSGIITITGSPDTSIPQENTETAIPEWVRGNAEWWAQGAIGDSDFVSGIQYLIKEGIMTIPETVQGTTGDDSQEIPAWIKNNADWWAQGLITDDDFVKGIQFLIENGIMAV